MEKSLILDIGIKSEIKEKLTNFFGLTILEAKSMTKEILAWPGWKNFEPKNTLLIFPGNGASVVKRFINLEDPAWLNQWPKLSTPMAKRVWIPGQNPRAYAERIFPQGFILGIKTAVIIDDVVSSGQTIGKIRRENEPFIPNIDWQVVCWVAQKAADTKGFSQILSAKTVGERNKKYPVNSLSTLIANYEIAKSYALRNFGEKNDIFLKIIKDLG